MAIKKAKEPKIKELPKCVYCGKDVHIKIDGGKAEIPISITYGQFPEYSKNVTIHNRCLNPCVENILQKRKPIKEEVVKI